MLEEMDNNDGASVSGDNHRTSRRVSRINRVPEFVLDMVACCYKGAGTESEEVQQSVLQDNTRMSCATVEADEEKTRMVMAMR
jgi:hypothetical protein